MQVRSASFNKKHKLLFCGCSYLPMEGVSARLKSMSSVNTLPSSRATKSCLSLLFSLLNNPSFLSLFLYSVVGYSSLVISVASPGLHWCEGFICS